MTDYSGERGNPGNAQCSDYWILFDAHYLKLHRGRAVVQAWHARSGRKDASGLFNYTVPQQRIANVGPIPEGEYWIQPSQLTWVLFGRTGWGKYRITIHPYPLTETYSRGGFFIHGGDVWGSAGCIDLTYGIESFADRIRGLDSGGCYVPLRVNYAGTTSLPQP